MFKKLLGTAFLFLFVISATAHAQLKIGYLNTQEVLSQMPQRSEVEQKLNSFIKGKQQELQQRTMAFQDSVANYQQNKQNLSSAEQQQREQELAKKEASLRQFQQQLQQQIQQRRSSLLQPLFDRMDQAISAVAEEHNLDFVLNKATSTGENVVFYAASEKLDITQQVLQHIKENSAQN